MSVDKAFRELLEPNEEPLLSGTEKFLTSVRVRTSKSGNTRKTTRTPIYTDRKVLITDRRVLRLGTVLPTKDTERGHRIYKIWPEPEIIPFTDLAFSHDKDGGEVKVGLRPVLYEPTVLTLGWDDPGLIDPSGWNALCASFDRGEHEPSEARKAWLADAAGRLETLKRASIDTQKTEALTFVAVFGGLGGGPFLLLVSMCMGFNALSDFWKLITWPSNARFSPDVPWLLLGTPCGVVSLFFGLLGVLVGSLTLRTWLTASKDLDEGRAAIAALRAETVDAG